MGGRKCGEGDVWEEDSGWGEKGLMVWYVCCLWACGLFGFVLSEPFGAFRSLSEPFARPRGGPLIGSYGAIGVYRVARSRTGSVCECVRGVQAHVGGWGW